MLFLPCAHVNGSPAFPLIVALPRVPVEGLLLTRIFPSLSTEVLVIDARILGVESCSRLVLENAICVHVEVG